MRIPKTVEQLNEEKIKRVSDLKKFIGCKPTFSMEPKKRLRHKCLGCNSELISDDYISVRIKFPDYKSDAILTSKYFNKTYSYFRTNPIIGRVCNEVCFHLYVLMVN